MASADPVLQYLYPEDQTGFAATNLIVGEKQTLNPPPAPEDNDGEITFHIVIPFAMPFYRDSLTIKHVPTGRMLIRGTDYAPGYRFNTASFELESKRGGIYGGILLYDRTLSGQIELSYQTLGGNWTLNENKIFEILSNRAIDPRTVTYEVVSGKPDVFPPLPHNHPVDDFTGAAEIIASNYDIAAAIRERTSDWLKNSLDILSDYYSKDEIDAMNEAKPYETSLTLPNATGVVSIDALSADVFRSTVAGNVTWTFTNRPFAVGTVRFIELRLRNGGNFTHVWPAGTVFADGDPTLTVNGLDKLIIELGNDYIDITVIRGVA